jgi:hypothetical protein
MMNNGTLVKCATPLKPTKAAVFVWQIKNAKLILFAK